MQSPSELMIPEAQTRAYYYTEVQDLGIVSLYDNLPEMYVKEILEKTMYALSSSADTNPLRMHTFNKLSKNTFHNRDFVDVMNEILALISKNLGPTGVAVIPVADSTIDLYLRGYACREGIMYKHLKAVLGPEELRAITHYAHVFHTQSEAAKGVISDAHRRRSSNQYLHHNQGANMNQQNNTAGSYQNPYMNPSYPQQMQQQMYQQQMYQQQMQQQQRMQPHTQFMPNQPRPYPGQQPGMAYPNMQQPMQQQMMHPQGYPNQGMPYLGMQQPMQQQMMHPQGYPNQGMPYLGMQQPMHNQGIPYPGNVNVGHGRQDMFSGQQTGQMNQSSSYNPDNMYSGVLTSTTKYDRSYAENNTPEPMPHVAAPVANTVHGDQMHYKVNPMGRNGGGFIDPIFDQQPKGSPVSQREKELMAILNGDPIEEPNDQDFTMDDMSWGVDMNPGEITFANDTSKNVYRPEGMPEKHDYTGMPLYDSSTYRPMHERIVVTKLRRVIKPIVSARHPSKIIPVNLDNVSDENTNHLAETQVAGNLRDAVLTLRQTQVKAGDITYPKTIYSAPFCIVKDRFAVNSMKDFIDETVMPAKDFLSFCRQLPKAFAKLESAKKNLVSDDDTALVSIYEKYSYLVELDTQLTDMINRYIKNILNLPVSIESLTEDGVDLPPYLAEKYGPDMARHFVSYADEVVTVTKEAYKEDLQLKIVDYLSSDPDVSVEECKYLVKRAYVGLLPVDNSSYTFTGNNITIDYNDPELKDIVRELKNLNKLAKEALNVYDLYVVTATNDLYLVTFNCMTKHYMLNKIMDY